MVDRDQVQKLLYTHFIVHGNHSLNDQGEVIVTGDLTLRTNLAQLPVRFAHVSGKVRCERNHLSTLEGAPLRCV